MVVQVKRCPNCLKQNVPRDAAQCPVCGHAFSFRPVPPKPDDLPELPPTARWVAPAPHDVTSAALASLFVVGSGQSYNGQSAKGIFLFLLSCAFYGVAVWLRSLEIGLLGVAVWGISIADAAVVAGRVLERQRVRPWEWF